MKWITSFIASSSAAAIVAILPFNFSFVLFLCLIFNWFRKQFRRALKTIKIGKKSCWGKENEHYYANNGGTDSCLQLHTSFSSIIKFYTYLKSFFSFFVLHIIQYKTFKRKNEEKVSNTTW